MNLFEVYLQLDPCYSYNYVLGPADEVYRGTNIKLVY